MKIFILLLLPFVGRAQWISPVDFFNGSVVHVQALSFDTTQVFQGSGFLVSHQGDRYLITNYHIISEYDYYSGQIRPQYPYSDLRIISYHPQPVEVEIPITDDYKTGRWRNIQTDLVAFLLPDSLLTSIPVINIDTYDSTQHLSRSGVEVFAVGFPDFRNSRTPSSVIIPSRTNTTSNQLINFEYNNLGELPMIQTDVDGAGDMSGGPVFIWPNRNEEPLFVGVHSSSDEGYGYFWPANFVKNLFEGN